MRRRASAVLVFGILTGFAIGATIVEGGRGTSWMLAVQGFNALVMTSSAVAWLFTIPRQA